MVCVVTEFYDESRRDVLGWRMVIRFIFFPFTGQNEVDKEEKRRRGGKEGGDCKRIGLENN